MSVNNSSEGKSSKRHCNKSYEMLKKDIDFVTCRGFQPPLLLTIHPNLVPNNCLSSDRSPDSGFFVAANTPPSASLRVWFTVFVKGYDMLFVFGHQDPPCGPEAPEQLTRLTPHNGGGLDFWGMPAQLRWN